MVTLYADVLFIINFSMDFISLYLTSKLMHMKASLSRLSIASVVGAVYSLVDAYIGGNIYISYFITIAVAPLLVYIALGNQHTVKRFFLASGIFFAASFLIAGAVSALYNFFAAIMKNSNAFSEYKYGGCIIVIALLGALLCTLLCRLITSISKRKCAIVKITCGDRISRVSALVDSGNLLRDPLTGKAVIVVNFNCIARILPGDVLRCIKDGTEVFDAELSYDSMRRVSVITVSGIGGSRLFMTFRPDNIIIEENGKSRALDALLAIDSRSGKTFGGYQALLPASLVN